MKLFQIGDRAFNLEQLTHAEYKTPGEDDTDCCITLLLYFSSRYILVFEGDEADTAWAIVQQHAATMTPAQIAL